MASRAQAATTAALEKYAEAMGPREDLLRQLRGHLVRARDLDLSIASTEERLRELREQRRELLERTMPDLFMEARVSRVDLDADGNLPPYAAEMQEYVHANIAADWEPERRQRALDYVEKREPDLLKTVITVEMGRGTRKLARQVEVALKKLKVHYSSERTVPWNTLTAWLRKELKSGVTPPLETIGATVGTVVRIKPVREK